MKKRIIALVLCVLIIAGLLPPYAYASTDYGSNVGKYAQLNSYYADSAVFIHDGSNNFALTDAMVFDYAEFEEGLIFRITDWYLDSINSALWYQVEAYWGNLPADMPAGYWIFQRYTDDDSEEDTLLFVTVEPTQDETTVTVEGIPATEYTMEKYEKPLLEASSTLTGTVSYRWQILADREANLWVDIYGQDDSTLSLSYAMVKSLLNSENQAWVRCISAAGEQEAVGEPFCVTVCSSNEETPADEETELAEETDPTEETLPTEEPQMIEEPAKMKFKSAARVAPAAEGDGLPEEPGEDDTAKTYILSILYVYGDESVHAGTAVAPTWSAQISPLQAYEAVIPSPEFPGYTPDQATVTFNYAADQLSSDVQIVVRYNPVEVAYTVLHRWQNIYDDEYADYETETRYGKTESLVPNDLYMKDGVIRYPGMEPLPYAIEAIAADGTTKIEIRYDRTYYLMTFDLDGGYGTLPIYARHGTSLAIPSPTKGGSTFMGWDKNGDGVVDATPTVMPIGSAEYKAIWKVDDASRVSFVFWGENADDTEYSYYGSKEVFAKPGTTINYVTGQNICGLEAHTHGDDCYGCGQQTHTHNDSCYDCEGVNHAHNRNCYNNVSATEATNNQKFGAPTNPVDGQIYKRNGQNRIIYINGTWYRYNGNQNSGTIISPNNNCPAKNHVHSDGCLICDGVHIHTDSCGLICTEHIHTHNEKCRVTILDKLNDTKYWTYDAAETDKNVVVKEDGTTVVNVYFKRTKFTINFSSRSNYNTPVIYTINEKWGADISKHWPIKGTDGVTYDSGQRWSPNGSSIYSQVLVYIAIMPAENFTLRLSTSTADTFIMHYMAEAIPGTTYTHTYNGKYFNELFVVNANYNHVTEDEDFFDLAGYDQWASNPTFSGGSLDIDGGGDVYFYYTRNSVDLTFHNGYEPDDPVSVLYGSTLEKFKGYEPEKPKNQDPESIYFDGWYLNPECSDGKKVDLDTFTMPDEPLILYAKWSKVVHTIRVWKFRDAEGNFSEILEDFNAPHNSLVQEQYIPETPGDEGHLKFDGWFYIDENGKEQAFDFYTIPVTRDLTIYAKWKSDQLRDVTVRYVTKVDGVDVEIAKTETFKGYVGDTKTYDAKTETQLYEGYRTKYYPNTASSSIVVSEDESKNELIFYYEYRESPPYTVEYWIEDTNGSLRPAFEKDGDGGYKFVGDKIISESEMYKKYVTDHGLSVATEDYLPAPQYIPDQLQKRLIISANESENVIRFLYTYSPDAAIYVVNHYLVKPGVEQVTGPQDYDLQTKEEFIGLVNDTVSANPEAVFGAEFNEEITVAQNPAADGYTWNGETLTLSAVVKGDNSTTLNFFYIRIDCEYRVRYVDKDTGAELGRKPGAGEPALKAQYGQTVTETAAIFDGYMVDSNSKSLTIQVGSAVTNTITFYYTRQTGDIQISKEVELDEDQVKENPGLKLPEGEENRIFEFTIIAKDKFHKDQFACTITGKNGVETTSTVSVSDSLFKELGPINLLDGEKIVIHGLSLGDYTVKETHVIGYKTTVDAVETETMDVTLDDHGEMVAVDFLNTYPFFTGDLILSKTIRKADASDPDGIGEIFTYTITVTPAAGTLEEDRVIKFKDLNGEGNVFDNTYTIPTGGYGEEYTFDLRLKAGDTVTVEDIPEGDIRVWETIDESYYATPFYKVSYTKKNHAQDTTPGNSSVVLSQIYGGHETTVEYTNTYKKDSLTIQKTVTQEYPYDTLDQDTFTFAVTGETKLPDGTYEILIGGTAATATVADGKVTLSANPQITVTGAGTVSLLIEKLPAGTYTVQETAAEKGLECYNQNPASGKVEDLQLTGTGGRTASFTNAFKRGKGDLYLEKELVAATGFNPGELPQGTKFIFTIALTEDIPDSVKVRVAYNGGAAQEVTLNDGALTVQMEADEYVTMIGLPVGKYRITEATIPSYANQFALKDDGAWVAQPSTSTVDGSMYLDVMVMTDQMTEVKCTNTYPVDRAELVLQKLVTREYDRDTLPDDSFTFTVTLAEEDREQYSYVIYNQDGTVYDADNTAVVNGDNAFTITLKAGQYAVVPDMPVCGYTVTESADPQHYNLRYQVYQSETGDTASTVVDTSGEVIASGNTGSMERTFAAGKTDTVVFTNQYKRHLTNLTIDRNAAADPEQVFVYEVRNIATGDIITVTVVGNGETTIYDLPYGDYTVTQRNDWSWRYQDESHTVTLSADNNQEGQAAKVVFNGSASAKWLDGFSQLIRNIYSGGGAG